MPFIRPLTHFQVHFLTLPPPPPPPNPLVDLLLSSPGPTQLSPSSLSCYWFLLWIPSPVSIRGSLTQPSFHKYMCLFLASPGYVIESRNVVIFTPLIMHSLVQGRGSINVFWIELNVIKLNWTMRKMAPKLNVCLQSGGFNSQLIVTYIAL